MKELPAAALMDDKLLTHHNLTLYDVLKWISNKCVDGRAQIFEHVLGASNVPPPTPAKQKRAKAQGKRAEGTTPQNLESTFSEGMGAAGRAALPAGPLPAATGAPPLLHLRGQAT
ncbi:hypothetical protein DUNSADRAFT_17160 [Dunaliella salina]|uniref:Uncharacterized protein n=1 Tax=Dunaliella salina TaxID=3046 RepID=A0ABQ7H0E9_DUNSA|nr:hypothetical protein DUNSADRAFT_17160 [Dunaliella salina]|eukprot:KAF5840316.1 hypothetical protein DUNSADRAFT_17160 [Dunaliella salina]